jgi:hypothetical protein
VSQVEKLGPVAKVQPVEKPLGAGELMDEAEFTLSNVVCIT